jgi:hypothetical protein
LTFFQVHGDLALYFKQNKMDIQWCCANLRCACDISKCGVWVVVGVRLSARCGLRSYIDQSANL